MDEIVAGVQVIKFYVWEKPFARLIAAARRAELNIILKNGYVRALYMSFSVFTTRMALYCTILSIILMYGRESIAVSKIFMISYMFSAISLAMCQSFVRGVAEVSELLIAIKRVQLFLQYDENETNRNIDVIGDGQLEARNLAILMKNVSATWSHVIDTSGDINADKSVKKNKKKEKDKKEIGSYKNEALPAKGENGAATLKDIDIEFGKGKLIGVIGEVGAGKVGLYLEPCEYLILVSIFNIILKTTFFSKSPGKTSLIQVILGELSAHTGSVGLNGKLSYSSQEPWSFAATVRQNITFGQPLDRMRYDAVVKCTALRKDFQQFSDGDQTLIGERGISLSGGQKARIK